MAMQEHDLRNIDDCELTLEEGSRPHIPPGKYQVAYVKQEKKRYYTGAKLYVTFEILSPGPYFGTKLFKAYNHYDPLPRGSDLFKELVFLYGKCVRKNMKLSTKLFRNKIFEVEVRTVTTNRKQMVFSEHQQYSVIGSILGVVCGDENHGGQ